MDIYEYLIVFLGVVYCLSFTGLTRLAIKVWSCERLVSEYREFLSRVKLTAVICIGLVLMYDFGWVDLIVVVVGASMVLVTAVFTFAVLRPRARLCQE